MFSVLATILDEASFKSAEGGVSTSGWLVSLISVACENITGEHRFQKLNRKSIHTVTSSMKF